MTVPKLAWVLAPLLLYGVYCAILAWRGRAPSRMALNVHISVLLLAYLLGTAGLGIFWVANQQLPVFDWHYLFGYATLILVSLHLVFNLPLVVRWLARRRGAEAPVKRGGPSLVGQAVLAGLALAAAFYVGKRQGGAEPAAAPVAGVMHPVEHYHTVSSESRSSVFQRAPGVDWGDAPEPFKQYPGVPEVLLERGESGAASLAQVLAGPVHEADAVRLADLGRMLYLSSGITMRRGGLALRAAPSSGALFPSELYVIARAVEGLAQGVYHYHPLRHRLQLIGPLPRSSGAPQADRADALIMLSAVFRRTGYKYRNRAYRYALADAGHLLENLRLAAHGAGLAPQLLPAFDDGAAARALGVDGVEECVLALMVLDPEGEGPAAPALPSAISYTPVEVNGGSVIGATGRVHQATSLRAEAAVLGARIALPPPAPAARELFATITERRSMRRFSPDPLPLAALSGVLADLHQAPVLYAGIEVSVVVNRVQGLAPGVYRYVAGHALRLVRAGDQSGAARSAALAQDVIGDTAAVLVLSTSRQRVLDGGARAYRHALLETGMMGERWLLGAVARGLAACPVGAFYDDEAAALIGADGAPQWVFHFAALGLPVD